MWRTLPPSDFVQWGREVWSEKRACCIDVFLKHILGFTGVQCKTCTYLVARSFFSYCRRRWGEGYSVGCNLRPHHWTLSTGTLKRQSFFSDVILKGSRTSPWKEVKRECWALLQVRVVSWSLMTPAGPSVGYLLSAGLNELAASPLQTSTSH